MFTISNIISDIDKACMANNMVEDMFIFRIIFFVNEGNKGFKYHIDSTYHDLRMSLEGIIKNHLSLTNSLVIAKTTVLKMENASVCRAGHMHSVWMSISGR